VSTAHFYANTAILRQMI